VNPHAPNAGAGSSGSESGARSSIRSDWTHTVASSKGASADREDLLPSTHTTSARAEQRWRPAVLVEPRPRDARRPRAREGAAPKARWPSPTPHADLSRAAGATHVAFFGTGFAFAGWAARIPQVKGQLGLNSSALGLVLLAVAAGAVTALPLSGPAVARFGSRRVITCMAVVAGAGLVTVALTSASGVAGVVIGLYVFGAGTGSWEMAMNVQGATVERGRGRSIMPRFHASFSFGTVAGALVGTAMIALDVSVLNHLLLVGVAIAIVVPFAVQQFIPDHADPATASSRATRNSLAAWRNPRTVLIGVLVLAFAFAEGSGNDWIGVATISSHHVPTATGELAFAVFLASATGGRLAGPWLLDGVGRVGVIRTQTVVAIVGLLLFAFGPTTPVAFIGVLLWGVGVSLGFPVGMSAAADDPALAAPRVSVVSSIAYCGFVAEPPLVGFLGQQFTVSHALAALVAPLAVAGLLAGRVVGPSASRDRVSRSTPPA
jgi:MFS family permease